MAGLSSTFVPTSTSHLTFRTPCDWVLHIRTPNTSRHPLPRRKLRTSWCRLPLFTYPKSGTPELSAAGEYDAGAKTYKLTLRQSSKKEGTLPFHIPAVVGLLLKEDGSEVSRRKGVFRSRCWFTEERISADGGTKEPTPRWKGEANYAFFLGG